MHFKEWLINEMKATSGKTGLYPLGYAGIGLYPPSAYIPVAADTIYYMSVDERLFKYSEWKLKQQKVGGKPSHLKMPPGEVAPWDITKVPGKPSHQKIGDIAANPGEGEPWNIRILK